MMTDSIWLGNTFTPRIFSMSSERPMTFSMRACVRPHLHGSVVIFVRSRVR